MTMNRQQAKEILGHVSAYVRNASIMEAYARGADIETLIWASKKWIEDPWPTFELPPSEYRVKSNFLKLYFSSSWTLISNSEYGLKFVDVTSFDKEEFKKIKRLCNDYLTKGIQCCKYNDWVSVTQPDAEDIAKNLGCYRAIPLERACICDMCAFDVDGDHCGLCGYTDVYPKKKSCRAFNTVAPNGFTLDGEYFRWAD